tara:strand:+ start:352 stop:498 length:147 start_codon:yes stop_codon:yes gene_type:complete
MMFVLVVGNLYLSGLACKLKKHGFPCFLSKEISLLLINSFRRARGKDV